MNRLVCSLRLKPPGPPGWVALVLALCTPLLAAPPAISSIVPIPKLLLQGDMGSTNHIQITPALVSSPWTVLTSTVVTQTPYTFIDASASPSSNRFYRVGSAPGHQPAITNISLLSKLTIKSDVGATNQIQYTPDPWLYPWQTLASVVVSESPYSYVDESVPAGTPRIYRVVTNSSNKPPPPPNMVFISAGSFQMGDSLDGMADALPVHDVSLGAFYMDDTEVSKAVWEEVRRWAVTNGYDFSSGANGISTNHPVHGVTWYDAVKWCNARSEKEGRLPAYYVSPGTIIVYRTGMLEVQNTWVLWNAGYRLPTEAEWEKAARGGNNGRRFPWADADTISHSRVNYYSFWQNGQPFYSYDVNSTNGYHPAFALGATPYTNPGNHFATNSFGLRDMAGNVWEWCWDWWNAGYYASSPTNNPLGPAAGSFRVLRGGSWSSHANGCRVATRGNGPADTSFNTIGFRCVLPYE